MRFSTPEQVLASADEAAADDFKRQKKYGLDLNPYSTQGGRTSWQRGFDGAPPYSWEDQTLAWDYQYQRGAAARRLVDATQG